MQDRVEFDGRTWWLCASGYYADKDGKKLHREVYRAAHGGIPKGYIIHHSDGNRGNNALSNLEAVPWGDHSRHHNTGRRFSDDDRAAHSRALKRFWQGARWREAVCCHCGASFLSRHHGEPRKFCSLACQEKYRSNAFKPEQRVCAECGCSFLATKRVQKFCSRQCTNRNCLRRLKEPVEPRTIACAHCGVSFQSKRANARFCSDGCAKRYHGAHQQRRKVSDAVPGL